MLFARREASEAEKKYESGVRAALPRPNRSKRAHPRLPGRHQRLRGSPSPPPPLSGDFLLCSGSPISLPLPFCFPRRCCGARICHHEVSVGQGHPGTGCPLRVFHRDMSLERASALRRVLLSGKRPRGIGEAAQRGIKPPFTSNFPGADAPCVQGNSRGSQVPPCPSRQELPLGRRYLAACRRAPATAPATLCTRPCRDEWSSGHGGNKPAEQGRGKKKTNHTDTFRDAHSGSHETPGMTP